MSSPKSQELDDASDFDQQESSFEVETILDGPVKKDGENKYLIKWRFFSIGESTWEPIANLESVKDVIQAFSVNVKHKIPTYKKNSRDAPALEVDKILEERPMASDKRQNEYLVKWKNFPVQTWEPGRSLPKSAVANYKKELNKKNEKKSDKKDSSKDAKQSKDSASVTSAASSAASKKVKGGEAGAKKRKRSPGSSSDAEDSAKDQSKSADDDNSKDQSKSNDAFVIDDDEDEQARDKKKQKTAKKDDDNDDAKSASSDAEKPKSSGKAGKPKAKPKRTRLSGAAAKKSKDNSDDDEDLSNANVQPDDNGVVDSPRMSHVVDHNMQIQYNSLKPCRVDGARIFENNVMFRVCWLDTGSAEFVSVKSLRKDHPQELVDFLLARLVWSYQMDKHGLRAVPNSLVQSNKSTPDAAAQGSSDSAVAADSGAAAGAQQSGAAESGAASAESAVQQEKDSEGAKDDKPAQSTADSMHE